MSSDEVKTISGWVSADTKDVFTSQVKERGQVQQRALDAALATWVLLPDELQASIMGCAPTDYAGLVKLIRPHKQPETTSTMERLYSTSEIAHRTGLPETMLRRMRHETYQTGRQVGPPWVQIRGRIFYELPEVERWIRIARRPCGRPLRNARTA